LHEACRRRHPTIGTARAAIRSASIVAVAIATRAGLGSTAKQASNHRGSDASQNEPSVGLHYWEKNSSHVL
jgi:hypothetical protein